MQKIKIAFILTLILNIVLSIIIVTDVKPVRISNYIDNND